jgi:hypothetical protein
MFSRVKAVATLIAASAVLAHPAAAQYRVHYGYYPGAPPMDPSISVYGGYMNLGQYSNSTLGTSVSGGDAGLVGGQLTLPLSPNFALVANGAHANSNLVFLLPSGLTTLGNSEVWLFDGDIQLSAPFRAYGGHWINPFLQLGAGGMQYQTQSTAGSTSATVFTFNVGGGLDYFLSHTVALRLLAKDYIGSYQYYVGYYNRRYTDNWSVSAGLLFGI